MVGKKNRAGGSEEKGNGGKKRGDNILQALCGREEFLVYICAEQQTSGPN